MDELKGLDIFYKNLMSKFRHPVTWFILSAIVMAMASACSSTQNEKAPPSGAQFDRDPDAVIVYAYVHYPGVPEPTKIPDDRYCPYIPSLLIWGDGFAFLDENIRNEHNSVLSGSLDSTTLQTLADILDADNFFTEWQVPAANPSGTALKIGAMLKDRPVTEYISGDLEPPIYLQLVETIKPELKPVAEQSGVDKRVDAILKENENCNK